jgi:hypothetical protein
VHVLGFVIEIWVLGFGLGPNCRRRQLSRQTRVDARIRVLFGFGIRDLDSSPTAYKGRVRDGRVSVSACTEKVFILGPGF